MLCKWVFTVGRPKRSLQRELMHHLTSGWAKTHLTAELIANFKAEEKRSKNLKLEKLIFCCFI